MKIIAGILAGLLSAHTCLAALSWAATDQELNPAVGQQSVSAIYHFRNAGDQPVRIVALDPSCRCVAAAPDRGEYGPGEGGEIRVDVALTGYVGRLRRSVAVETDDPAHRFYELTLTVNVREPVAITPRFLYWRTGEAPAEKSLTVVLANPANTSLGAATSDSAQFHVRLERATAGEYRMFVEPAGTGVATSAVIRLTATIGGAAQTYIIYVAVK